LLHGFDNRRNEQNQETALEKMLLTSPRTRRRRVRIQVQETLKRIRAEREQLCSSSQLSCDENSTVNRNPKETLADTTDNLFVSLDLNNGNAVDIELQNNESELLHIDCTEVGNITRREELASWAVTHNIPHNALSSLLQLTRKWLPHEGFPKDPRTLLKTERLIEISLIEGGSFYHFGVSTQILKILRDVELINVRLPHLEVFQNQPNLITLKIGVDGLPISRSSNLQFWPLLGKLDQDPYSRVFIISIFYGTTKPQNLNSYLGSFVEEMMEIEKVGIVFNNITYSLRIRCIVADAPARSFIKRIKSHNGYYGCEKCYRRGTYKNSRIIYPVKAPGDEYSDQSFKERWYEAHHKDISTSPLESLSLGMISQIPLDYMHLCLLGTMKKLLLVWTEGKRPYKLSNGQQNLVSKRLKSYRVHIPQEFARKCRGMNELKHWKATELRLFLIYVGPVALRKILDQRRYEHFLCYHTAIYILSLDLGDKKEWINFAQCLIDKFVTQIPILYYKELLVYNMHSLTHLCADVKVHGSLDNFSAFEFENYMQTLKRMLRSKSCHLSQVVRRVGEAEALRLKETVSKNQKLISVSKPNNCYVDNDGRIIVLEKQLTETVFVANRFRTKCNMESYPCESHKLGIHVVSDLTETDSFEICKSQISKKCLLLPLSEKKYFCVPMCNY